MFERLSGFLRAETRLKIDLPPHAAATLLMNRGFPVFRQKVENGVYTCSLPSSCAGAALRLCAEKGISCIVLYERGPRVLIRKILGRPGLAVGAAAALFLIYFCSCHVWQIDVTGNEKLTRAEVAEILREEGFSIGCRYTSMDLDALCRSISEKHPRIAWITVNMKGSVAKIELAEHRDKEPMIEERETEPFDLVAACDGQIVRYELACGRPVVGVGSAVSQGQVLVTGFTEKNERRLLLPSAGRVYAKVVLEETLTGSKEVTLNIAQEPVVVEKSVNILGKEIFFFKKGLQSGQKYDIVTEEYRPTVFGVSLPFTVTERRLVPTSERTEKRSAEETVRSLKTALSAKLRASCSELLEVTYTVKETENDVTVRAVAVCVKDIALRKKTDPPRENDTDKDQNQ